MTETELSGPPISRCGSPPGKGPANWAGARAPASAGDAGAGRPGRASRVLGFPEPLGGAPRGLTPRADSAGARAGTGAPRRPRHLRCGAPSPRRRAGKCRGEVASAPGAPRTPPAAPRPARKRNVPSLPRSRPGAPPIAKEAGKGGRRRGRGRGTPLPRFSSRARLPGRCAASSTRSAAASVPEGRIAAPGALPVSVTSPRRAGRRWLRGWPVVRLEGGGRRRCSGLAGNPGSAGRGRAHRAGGGRCGAAAQRPELPRRLARGAGARGGRAGRRRDQERGRDPSRSARGGGRTRRPPGPRARRGPTAVAPGPPAPAEGPERRGGSGSSREFISERRVPSAVRQDPALADWRCSLGDPACVQSHLCQCRRFPPSSLQLAEQTCTGCGDLDESYAQGWIMARGGVGGNHPFTLAQVPRSAWRP